jgi:hypothetical protein
MQTTIKRSITGIVLAAALSARADVLVQEDFSSYANGSITTPSALTGGTGWSGGWGYVGSGTNLQIVDKIWPSFIGYGFAPTKAVTTADANGPQFSRLIDTSAVDFTVPGTYYFSLLVDNEETLRAYFTGVTSNSTPSSTAEAQLQWRDGANKDFQATMNTVAIGDTAALPSDSDYLLVGKIVVSATSGASSLSFAYFSAGQNVRSEPAWGIDSNSISGSGNYDSFNRFGLLLNGSEGNNPMIGNIVIGQSYADVIDYVDGIAKVSFRYGTANTRQWMRANPDGWPVLKAQADLLHGDENEVGDMFVTKLHQHAQYFDGIAIGDIPNDYTNPIIGEIIGSESKGWQEAQICLRRETMLKHGGPPGPFPWAETLMAPEDVDDCRAAITDAYNRGMINFNHYKLPWLGGPRLAVAAIANASSEAVLLTLDGIAMEIHYDGWADAANIMDTAQAIKWCLDHNKIAQVHLGGKQLADMQEGFIPLFQTLWSNLAALGVDYRNPGIIYHHNLNDVAPDEMGPEWQARQSLWYTRWLINEIKFGPDSVAPATPTSLTAIAGSGSVILDWNDNSETDLFSYSVYRSTGGAYTLQQAGLPFSRYSDLSAPNGTACSYKVTAVDQWGNESAVSTQVATTPVAIGAGDVLVGWHSPSASLPDTTPDVAMPGISGTVTAVATVTTANSTDGTYGSGPAVSGTTVNALRVNGQTALNPENNLVHVTISNGTGSPIELGEFHCDYAMGHADSPKSVALYYESGDLAVAPDTFIGTNMDGTAGITPAVASVGNFTDMSWSLAALSDTVLGVGETATFRLKAGAWIDKMQFGYIDNIAITRPHVNAAPIANNQTASTPEDTAKALTLTATDPDSTNLTYAVLANPANGALSGVNPSTGAITYTPAANYSGLDSFTFTVSDGALSSTGTVSLTVAAVNDAPVFAANPITGPDATEDAAYTGSIAGSATDDDVDPLVYAIISGPAWLSCAANGTLSGTPPNSNVGSNSFTVSVSDGFATPVQATLNITVINANDAPTWASNPINGTNATEDAVYSGSIADSASDVDAGASLTFAKVNGPTWLVLGSNGSLSGTPANSNVGANSFTVSVSDGIATAVQTTLNLTVANTNDAPVFTANPIMGAAASEGVAYTGQTLAGQATDSDGGDTITYSKVSGPAWLAVASNGTLSGTPDTGTAGLNSFVVRATDSNSATADATLQITVAGLPLPWVSSDIGTGMLAGSVSYNAGTFTQAGSGTIGSTADKLRFTYQTLTGDGEIIARISTLQNTGSSSRVGVMIRDSLAANSKQIFMGMTGTNAYRWVRRTATGGSTSSSNSNTGAVPDTWVRLVRSGSTITAYKSVNGTSWTTVGSTTNTTFASTCYIGLAVSSGSDFTLNTSQFNSVQVSN